MQVGSEGAGPFVLVSSEEESTYWAGDSPAAGGAHVDSLGSSKEQ